MWNLKYNHFSNVEVLGILFRQMLQWLPAVLRILVGSYDQLALAVPDVFPLETYGVVKSNVVIKKEHWLHAAFRLNQFVKVKRD
jgi:hypothetical protein